MKLSRKYKDSFSEFLKGLSQNAFQSINEKEAGGRTILHRAARIYDEKVIRLLIEKGAKVNIEDDRGETPLHIAAFHGKVENVKALLVRRSGSRCDGRWWIYGNTLCKLYG